MAVPLLVFFGWCALGQANFRQDFRQPLAEDRLLMVGADSEPFVRRERGGLRVKMPAADTTPRRIGVSPTFELVGDFEAAFTFDLVRIGRPAAGKRAGVGIYVRTGSFREEGLAIWWMRRAHEKTCRDTLLCQHVITDDSGKRIYRNQEFPATGAGRYTLQIARHAKRATFSVVCAGENPRKLHTCDFDQRTISFMRCAADDFESDTPLDIRLVELQLKAKEFIDPPPMPSISEPSLKWWIRWIAMIVIGALAAYALWKRVQGWARPAWERF